MNNHAYVKYSLLAVGLLSLMSAVAHADVLSDETRLSDLVPGTTLVISKPIEVCSNHSKWYTTWYFPDTLVGGNVQTPQGPLCKTFTAGARIKLSAKRFSGGSATNFDITATPSVTLTFDDSYLRSITTTADGATGTHSDRDLTIKDLRRSLDWGVWFEAPDAKTLAAVEDHSGVKAVDVPPAEPGTAPSKTQRAIPTR